MWKRPGAVKKFEEALLNENSNHTQQELADALKEDLASHF